MRPRFIITGASSLIARYLVPRLRAQGRDVILTSRLRPDYLGAEDRVRWFAHDLQSGDLAGQPIAADVLIHLAPLPLLKNAVRLVAGTEALRVIAFGTTSRFTKADSPVAAERQMAAEQGGTEAWLADAGSALRWTLFRPTMVYDGKQDKNVALIARFIRRFGFFPLVGAAAGLRQPVHAADLATACSLVLEIEATFGKAYNLGGGETLSYRDMVMRIFTTLGKKPRLASIPPPLLKAALELTRHLPRYRYLNASMADRMNKDMVFDSSRATRDFGYNPQRFLLNRSGK